MAARVEMAASVLALTSECLAAQQKLSNKDKVLSLNVPKDSMPGGDRGQKTTHGKTIYTECRPCTKLFNADRPGRRG